MSHKLLDQFLVISPCPLKPALSLNDSHGTLIQERPNFAELLGVSLQALRSANLEMPGLRWIVRTIFHLTEFHLWSTPQVWSARPVLRWTKLNLIWELILTLTSPLRWITVTRDENSDFTSVIKWHHGAPVVGKVWPWDEEVNSPLKSPVLTPSSLWILASWEDSYNTPPNPDMIHETWDEFLSSHLCHRVTPRRPCCRKSVELEMNRESPLKRMPTVISSLSILEPSEFSSMIISHTFIFTCQAILH